ncbi:neurotrophin 1-like isoform X2 [Artemia franciscana]|uniref:neurotrophin 1-like isoform X2 n=1 Tax=Artemia franciscana TaxID=6661 RepID=UPI0032DA13E7
MANLYLAVLLLTSAAAARAEADAKAEADPYRPQQKPAYREPYAPKPHEPYPSKYPHEQHSAYDQKYPAHGKPSYGKPSYGPSYEKPYGKPVYDSSYEKPYGKPAYESSYEKPYGKPDYCDPKLPPKCETNGTNFCLEDYEYPEYEIKAAIEADYYLGKKYSDVPEQSADDLVDGLTRYQEEAFDYSYYSGPLVDKTHWIGPEGYICPSDVTYARPKRARNVNGEWRVIVQDVLYYTQTQRMETCLFPGGDCRTIAPCYKSQCLQKYVYHRMLSFDPCDTYKGLFIDIYRLPSACSCHIPY